MTLWFGLLCHARNATLYPFHFCHRPNLAVRASFKVWWRKKIFIQPYHSEVLFPPTWNIVGGIFNFHHMTFWLVLSVCRVYVLWKVPVRWWSLSKLPWSLEWFSLWSPRKPSQKLNRTSTVLLEQIDFVDIGFFIRKLRIISGITASRRFRVGTWWVPNRVSRAYHPMAVFDEGGAKRARLLLPISMPRERIRTTSQPRHEKCCKIFSVFLSQTKTPMLTILGLPSTQSQTKHAADSCITWH
jgi:hypothetical protein